MTETYLLDVKPHPTVENTLCVVSVRGACAYDTFSFNLDYLFDQVLKEHRLWFLREIITKKMEISFDVELFPSLEVILGKMETIYLHPKD